METPTIHPEGLRDELMSDAENMTTLAKDRLQSEMTEQKGEAVDQARNVSTALENAAEGLDADSPAWLKSAMRQGASAIQKFAESVDRMDSAQMTRDVQRLARENPGTFLAGCAFAGFAAARVFQAGIPAGGTQQPTASEPYAVPGMGGDRPAISFENGQAPNDDAFPVSIGVAT